MNASSQQLIITGALDIRTRFVRLLALLERTANGAADGERRVLDSVSATVRGALTEYVEGVEDVLEGGGAMTARSGSAPWPIEYRQALVAQVEAGYEKLRQEHQNAYTYVSGHSRVPEDLNHFLFRSLELSLVSKTHREAVATYPSHHMMWESSSTTRGDAGAGPVTAGILIPYSEVAAPNRWPLLVHELAHHVSPGGENSDALRTRVLKKHGLDDDGVLDDALAELQADRIAENAAGATYALAMAREAYLIRISSHSRQTGPTVKQRLEQLEYGQQIAAELPDEWHLAGGRFDRKRTVVEKPLDQSKLDKLSEILREIVPPVPQKPDATRVERAQTLLRVNDPIPSIPRAVEVPPELLAAAAAQALDVEGVQALFNAIVQDPLSDAEILEAAWAEELGQPEAEVIEKLRAPVTDTQLQKETSALDADDVRLSRSLQAAAVHRWLLKYDEEIEERARAVPLPPIPAEFKVSKVLEETSPLSDLNLVQRLAKAPTDSERLVVRPIVDPAQVGGTTIDLRLGTEWETLRTSRFRSLDPSDEQAEATDLLNQSVDEFRLAADDANGLVLHPGELLLALSLEYLALPNDLWGNLEGRSTWARLGLQVHATAGMVDAGFRGFLTLELQNNGRLPLVLYPGIRIAQMAFFPVAGIARPYGAKSGAAYLNQARVRTAFTNQHEHRARHDYMAREADAERLRTEPKPVPGDHA